MHNSRILVLATVAAGAMGMLAANIAFSADYYPENYGAVTGDISYAGSNVTAINAALNAARNTGGRVVLNGLYYVNGRINGQSGVTLTVGEAGGTIKAVPNLSQPSDKFLVRVSGQTGFIIDGVELDGNRTNQPQDASHAFGGVLLKNSTQCTIKNSKVHDFNGQTTGGATGNGIMTMEASGILISGNQIHSNNGCGINLNYSSSNIQAINNTIWNNTEIGIESEGRNGSNYADYRNSSITINSNVISGQTESGRLSDHGILMDWTDGAVINANRCTNNNHNGIEILGSTKTTVYRNTLAYNGDIGAPYTWAGIRVAAEGFGENGRSYDTTISENHITGSQYGIYVDTATRTVASGNTIDSTANAALTVGAIGANTVTLIEPNNYALGTIVNGGTLLVNNTSGSGAGSGPMTINAGGTLSGSGTIGGSVTIASQATLAPGTDASIGKLTINGNVLLNTDSLLKFRLASENASDRVSMNSALLTLSGQEFDDFTFTDMPGFGEGTYVLFDARAITGSLGKNVSGPVGGLQGTLAVSGNDLVLVTTVPEPRTASLMVTAVVGLHCYVWRSRQ